MRDQAEGAFGDVDEFDGSGGVVAGDVPGVAGEVGFDFGLADVGFHAARFFSLAAAFLRSLSK